MSEGPSSNASTPGGPTPGGPAPGGPAAGDPAFDGPRPSAPSYEAARAELEDVVHRLEAGGVSLEESLALWERGEELARVCQSLLEGARTRLTAADQPAT
ncbi:Exodeoxyribonuclease 7 small subunit [Frankia canadensis]|uniref:Exodeoxyribonuclease 7 small subunit n=1 Tax=Frankia canadensis TaxID=1836972 RepID=A0A2I2KLY1_9ACTN|nr:exodeoxyribonuclease VII small subunit [Frankia canadensis]SNQ46673.1 Exodeoxyribonuclease 7 small subunit [Frankia canadensis]SOU53963.1 Exodeoxyribonuclease 7 small subunit [Frankia canadensis]